MGRSGLFKKDSFDVISKSTRRLHNKTTHGSIHQQQPQYSLLTRRGIQLCAVEPHAVSAKNQPGQVVANTLSRLWLGWPKKIAVRAIKMTQKSPACSHGSSAAKSSQKTAIYA
jgi:hypothetical protein